MSARSRMAGAPTDLSSQRVWPKPAPASSRPPSPAQSPAWNRRNVIARIIAPRSRPMARTGAARQVQDPAAGSSSDRSRARLQTRPAERSPSRSGTLERPPLRSRRRLPPLAVRDGPSKPGRLGAPSAASRPSKSLAAATLNAPLLVYLECVPFRIGPRRRRRRYRTGDQETANLWSLGLFEAIVPEGAAFRAAHPLSSLGGSWQWPPRGPLPARPLRNFPRRRTRGSISWKTSGPSWPAAATPATALGSR